MTFDQMYYNALGINASIYNNIQSGYQQILAQQEQAEQGVISGYNTLGQNVQKTIANVDQAALNKATALYTQQMGSTQQSAISKGLGNEDILSAARRANVSDYSMATTAIEDQFAQLKAGYQAQIGLAGLNYQGQAINANSAVGLAGLGLLAGFKAPYPSFSGGGGGGGGYGAGNVIDNNSVGFDPNWGSNYGGAGGYDPTGASGGFSYGSGMSGTPQYAQAGGGGAGRFGSYTGNTDYGGSPNDPNAGSSFTDPLGGGADWG